MRLTLQKATIEPGTAHVIGAYEAGFGIIIEGDLANYAFFVVKSRPDGSEPLSPPIFVIEGGGIKLTRTEGFICLINCNGLLTACNDKYAENVNIGYFFVPYKFE